MGRGVQNPTPPPTFSSKLPENGGADTPYHNLFRIRCENFRPRSRKSRNQVPFKWPHLIESSNARQSYTGWTIALKLSASDTSNSVYKMFISEFQYWWSKVRSILWLPHYKSIGENWKAPVLDENHYQHTHDSNIGLQEELHPQSKKLPPVAPPQDPKVTPGHERSPAVFRQ